LGHLSKSEYKSIGYQVECYYGIGLCLEKLGDINSALDHIEKAIALNKDRDASEELEGPLENYDEILDNLTKLNKSLK
jgi:tetratricopeptide (TPR) repeat protein